MLMSATSFRALVVVKRDHSANYNQWTKLQKMNIWIRLIGLRRRRVSHLSANISSKIILSRLCRRRSRRMSFKGRTPKKCCNSSKNLHHGHLIRIILYRQKLVMVITNPQTNLTLKNAQKSPQKITVILRLMIWRIMMRSRLVVVMDYNKEYHRIQGKLPSPNHIYCFKFYLIWHLRMP